MIGQSARDSEDSTRAEPACFVVVCRGPNCRERGGLTLRTRLAERLRHEPTARLVGYACFGQCDSGPNVAFYPEGAWYGGLSADDAADRIARHATGEEAFNATPLSLPEPERREHLKNIGDLVDLLERDRLRKRHWWWPF